MDIQIWISSALTLFILSFLYRDNPLYKLAEHLFVGISAGYYIALAYQETIRPNLIDAVVQDHQFVRVGALLLSLLMFTRFIPKVAWLSRWPLAFVVGMYAGINVIAFGSGDLIIQLQSTMLDVLHGGAGAVSNVLLVVGLASSLLYFYFSREHTGALGVVSRVGVWFLMVSFGASFGYTVMSRVSLAIGRTRALMEFPQVTAVLMGLVILVLFLWSRRAGPDTSGGGS
ncbi:hypothetical protein K8I85_00570 [bacterium]|nr:hypothetical protein [bacterium]